MAYKSVNVEITQEHFDRSIKGSPKEAVKELIWNACDADAKNIEVSFDYDGIAGADTFDIKTERLHCRKCSVCGSGNSLLSWLWQSVSSFCLISLLQRLDKGREELLYDAQAPINPTRSTKQWTAAAHRPDCPPLGLPPDPQRPGRSRTAPPPSPWPSPRGQGPGG